MIICHSWNFSHCNFSSFITVVLFFFLFSITALISLINDFKLKRYTSLQLHRPYKDGLVQKRRNCSALAMVLRLSCTNPSISLQSLSLMWMSLSISLFFSCKFFLICSAFWNEKPPMIIFLALYITWHCSQFVFIPSGVLWFQLTFDVLIFFLKNDRNKFVFSIISWRWDGGGSNNPSSWKTRTPSSYIVNTIAADGLVIQGARESAAPILTFVSGIVLFQH